MVKLFKTDMTKINKKLAELSSGKFYKPREGKNFIRILPGYKDNGLFHVEATYHYGLKKDNKTVTVKGPHPLIMDFIKDGKEEGGVRSRLAKRLEPRTKFFANVIDRSTGKVSVWGFSQKIYRTLASAMGDPDIGDITDLDEGHDVVIERTGTGMETKYEVRIRPKSTPAGDEFDPSQVKEIESQITQEFTDKEVKQMLRELVDAGDTTGGDLGDDDDDPKPPKKSSDLKDDDDEDLDDKDKKSVDDDEEDDPKPAKREKPVAADSDAEKRKARRLARKAKETKAAKRK